MKNQVNHRVNGVTQSKAVSFYEKIQRAFIFTLCNSANSVVKEVCL